MSEGKTLGTPNINCDSCNEDSSSQFCIDCNQRLCTNCLTYHRRLAATRHHRTISIDQHLALASSTTSISSGTFCAKHPNNVIEKLCEDCLKVLCKKCESDHKGHNIIQPHDANLLHRVSALKVPGLLELLQQLKDFNDGTPEKIKLYKEAEKLVRDWKDELLVILTKDADRLLREIRSEIQKQETLIAETFQKANEYINRVDKEISQLSEARRITDTDKLLTRLTKCDIEVEKAKHFISKQAFVDVQGTVKDVLPYQNDYGNTKTLLKQLLSWKVLAHEDRKNASSNTYQSVKVEPSKNRNYKKLFLIHDKPITKAQSYKVAICENFSPQPHRVVTYTMCENDIKIFDEAAQLTDEFKCSTRIYRMVSSAENVYLAIEYDTSVLYLLNKAFVPVKTIMFPRNGFRPEGICLRSQNKVVVAEFNISKQVLRINEITINEGNIRVNTLMDIKDHTDFFDGVIVYHNGCICMAKDCNTLRSVNLHSGNDTEIHIPGIIRSICVDGESILVGNQNGNVYRIKDGRHLGSIITRLQQVWGVSASEKSIFVTSGEYSSGFTLKVYSNSH